MSTPVLINSWPQQQVRKITSGWVDKEVIIILNTCSFLF